MTEEQAGFSPREVVSELDRYIIGQEKAKRAVAVALRNRWRRRRLPESLREEVYPKNILMIGPTGVGKTEIARRLAKLSRAPFVKVEATKFTEVGYVGRDVEQIVRDLVEIALHEARERARKRVLAQAELNAEKRVLDALSRHRSTQDREQQRAMLRRGELGDQEIELELSDPSGLSLPQIDIPGMPGASFGMLDLSSAFGKAFSSPKRKRRMRISESRDVLIAEESDALLEGDNLAQVACKLVSESGIVFLDEIDKIAAPPDRRSGEVSREGVQRDLLPLIEGTTVSTKHGTVKTDHILFIASGAFHASKPSDLLPELQGRLPIRVRLEALNQEDFRRILTEPESSLIRQYVALMETERVTLRFEEDSITEIALLAAEINRSVENIGARRLHTVLERLLEDISFTATDRAGEEVVITSEDVRRRLRPLTERSDIEKFIL